LSHATGQNSIYPPIFANRIPLQNVLTKTIPRRTRTSKSTQPDKNGTSRLEAIREVERDILDSLKRLSKYTTDMSMQKLHAMPFDFFTRKQAALAQFKRLYKRTFRATRDGQQLAPRLTKHDFYYRLLEEFVYLLDMQNDQLLEIEETVDSLHS
jgi:hypothetical protein